MGSIQQTIDGGYILTVGTYSFGAGNDDFGVLKLDSGGNIEWEKSYGGVNPDSPDSILQTSDSAIFSYVKTGFIFKAD